MLRYSILLCAILSVAGCALIPEVTHKPVIRNPFPQLSRVAVVSPFYNLSGEPTVNGEAVALAYFGELQQFAGFELVPNSVVGAAIVDHRIDVSKPAERRRLARLLEVDALVVGAVTDFSMYYPPRMGLRVQWYTANPCFHPIPPGYGLPWGTTEEEFIPDSLIFEAEMALARVRMAAQTPEHEPDLQPAPPARPSPAGEETGTNEQTGPLIAPATFTGRRRARLIDSTGTIDTDCATAGSADSPPAGPQATPRAVRAAWRRSDGPVMHHTRVYSGHDGDFTAALAGYYYFRDDARFGGWPAYLERTDDFVRFCCHKHIAEMLSARGGAGQSRVVYRWRNDR